jgi:superfamily II DNA or RNA helicase
VGRVGDLAERMADVRYPGVLRPAQVAALAALDARWAAGAMRAWVTMPPGAGKTVVALETARRAGLPVVVLAPNPAVQSQWVRTWRQFGPPVVRAGTDRDLGADITVLPYSALTTFAPDDEVDADGERTPGRPALALPNRLHVHGRALLAALAEAGPLTLVLDECHHLLEVWGHLLGELLDQLPEARVVGLTATPADALPDDEAATVLRLFGPGVACGSQPGGVRDGDLAPFAALARLVAPMAEEADWLAEEAARFDDLLAALLDPGLAPVGFLPWVVSRVRAVPWPQVEADEPELADAALRLHAAGLLALPSGARPQERHRRPPTGADWALLVDDYARGCLLASRDEASRDAFDRLRALLPGIGWTLTRGGLRQGRTAVDRLLARSEAKAYAAVEVLRAEADALGERLRAVVLTDSERAPATLPAALVGVLPAQAGSARHLLGHLLDDPGTAALAPVLVTGRAVAAEAETARALVDFVAARSPRTRLDPVPVDGSVVEVTGDWTAAAWAGHVTAFLETGRTRLLVGTRGLLGEGWDARGVNVLVDLTTAATPAAVASVRGRALRADGDRSEGHTVAHLWSVVCVADGHPRAETDWARFVRRHAGLVAPDADGDLVEGVAHVHPALSPAAPPPLDHLPGLDGEVLARVASRPAVRDAWRVGSPYDDEVHAVAWTDCGGPREPGGVLDPADGPPEPPRVLPAARGWWRDPDVPDPRRGHVASWAALVAGAAVPLLLGVPEASVPAGVAAAAPVQWTRSTYEAGRLARAAAGGPDVVALACAVADGLRDAEVMPVGAEALSARVDAGGRTRIGLTGAGPVPARLFAEALEEVLGAVGAARYLVPRWVPDPVGASSREQRRAGRAWLARRGVQHAVAHHAVPGVLGASVRSARAFGAAWSRWVSAGAEPVYTGSDDGAALLAACQGVAPLPGVTVTRRVWR